MFIFCIAKFSYFALQNFHISHFEIFVLYIAKLQFFCILHLRNFEASKNEKISQKKTIFRNAKSKIFAFRFCENCEFQKVVSFAMQILQ